MFANEKCFGMLIEHSVYKPQLKAASNITMLNVSACYGGRECHKVVCYGLHCSLTKGQLYVSIFHDSESDM